MNYTEFTNAVTSFTVRDDLPITTLIQLAEASLRPIVRHYLAEKTVTLNLVDDIAELPSDFLEMRALTGASGFTYKPISPASAEIQFGQIGYYRIGDSLSFVPAADGQTEAQVTLAYHSSFAPLTDLQTNFLFSRFENIYLRAVLREAYRWLQDAQGVAIQDAALKEELSFLAEDNRRGTMTSTILWRDSAWQ
jgi:hypothetical protein